MIVSLLSVILLSSCTTVRYVNKPELKNPNIGSDRNTKRIIIALDAKQVKDYHTDKCIESIISYIDKSTSIQIIDKIKFTQEVDTAVLQEVICDYNVDGLLLLTDLYIGETILDKVTNSFHTCYKNNKGTRYLDVHLWFNIHTTWEYFDFNNKNTYKFYANNEQSTKIRYKLDQDKNIERDIILQKSKVLIENGLLCSTKLIGY